MVSGQGPGPGQGPSLRVSAHARDLVLDLVGELLLEIVGEAGVVESLLVDVAAVPHSHSRLRHSKVTCAWAVGPDLAGLCGS